MPIACLAIHGHPVRAESRISSSSLHDRYDGAHPLPKRCVLLWLGSSGSTNVHKSSHIRQRRADQCFGIHARKPRRPVGSDWDRFRAARRARWLHKCCRVLANPDSNLAFLPFYHFGYLPSIHISPVGSNGVELGKTYPQSVFVLKSHGSH